MKRFKFIAILIAVAIMAAIVLPSCGLQSRGRVNRLLKETTENVAKSTTAFVIDSLKDCVYTGTVYGINADTVAICSSKTFFSKAEAEAYVKEESLDLSRFNVCDSVTTDVWRIIIE